MATGWTDKRPKSPHVTVWRWHMTMMGSILHRATGFGNYAGAALATAWLFMAASGPEAYDAFASLTGHPAGQAVLFLFSASVAYHLLSGLRHLVWDAGHGMRPRMASALSFWSVVLALVIVAGVWLAADRIPGISIGDYL
jgi:succinate dehydrogenase / fumarate reductase, cytochrome b subunit